MDFKIILREFKHYPTPRMKQTAQKDYVQLWRNKQVINVIRTCVNVHIKSCCARVWMKRVESNNLSHWTSHDSSIFDFNPPKLFMAFTSASANLPVLWSHHDAISSEHLHHNTNLFLIDNANISLDRFPFMKNTCIFGYNLWKGCKYMLRK